MKKLLILILTFVGINAMAQVMPDSTAQFVANWTVGDSYKYDHSVVEYKTKGADTTEVKHRNEIVAFEVIDATPTSYKLKAVPLETTLSDELENAINQMYASTFGDMALIITTDQHGTVTGCENAEEIVANMKQLVEPMVDMMEGLTPADKKMVVDYLNQMYDNPNFADTLLEEYLPLFMFHGLRFDIDNVYEGEIEVPSFIPYVQTPLKLKTELVLRPENVKEDYATPIFYTYSDENELTTIVNEAMKGVFETTELDAATLQLIMQQMSTAKYTYQQTLANQIHFATGIPVTFYLEQVITAEMADVVTKKVKQVSFTYIVEE